MIKICVEAKNLITLGLINEDKVARWILPHLSKGKRGFKLKIDLVKMVLLILNARKPVVNDGR